MKIIRLKKEHYSKIIQYNYETTGHFKANVRNNDDSFHFDFVYEDLGVTLSKSFEAVLVPDYLEKPICYGIFVQDTIAGYCVLNHEDYNNRLRIVQLLVMSEHRYQGLGKKLMYKAEQNARKIKARSIILETQSCNIQAIRFYRSCGYHFVGCDINSYTNNDVEANEVRIEMAKIIEQPD